MVCLLLLLLLYIFYSTIIIIKKIDYDDGGGGRLLLCALSSKYISTVVYEWEDVLLSFFTIYNRNIKLYYWLTNNEQHRKEWKCRWMAAIIVVHSSLLNFMNYHYATLC